MKKTLIVSSLSGVTARCVCEHGLLSVAVDIRSGPAFQYNWFDWGGTPTTSRADFQAYWLKQGVQLGRLALDLQRIRLSNEDTDKVVKFVGDHLAEWMALTGLGDQ